MRHTLISVFNAALLIGYFLFVHFTVWKPTSKYKEHLAAVVLARGGSKGIRLKNISPIGNTTLLGRAIRTIQRVQRFKNIWVSTDHEGIAKEARIHGALVHNRKPHTATDAASSVTALKEFLYYHPEITIIALVQCTSPFLRSEKLLEAIEMMQTNKYESVFSVTRQFKLRWKSTDTDMYEAENFDPRKRPRRQDWEGELIENGMFYFVRTDHVTRENLLQPQRVGVVEISPRDSIEIDTTNDLNYIQYLMNVKNLS